MLKLNKREHEVVADYEQQAASLSVLNHAITEIGKDTGDVIAVLVGAVILATAGHVHADDLLKVGIDSLAQARVQTEAHAADARKRAGAAS